MRSLSLTVLLSLQVLGVLADATAAEKLRLDFEQGTDVARYRGLDFGKNLATVVSGGADGGGHCLRVQSQAAQTSCAIVLRQPFRAEKNLVLSFDYKVEIEPGFEGAYLGISFRVAGKQWFWTSEPFSAEWRHAVVPVAGLKAAEHEVAPGMEFSGVEIYGRVREKGPQRGKTKARMTVWLDNLCLSTMRVPGRLGDKVRESYANPPFLNWPPSKSPSVQRLEYSRDAGFPKASTVEVAATRNFHTPPRPLEPGTWYWRVWSETPLGDYCSDVERVVVLPEAHRFQTAALSAEALTNLRRPRLAPLARVDQPEVTAKRKTELIRLAEKIFKRGVGEHPGPHIPGDPRWPTWIDWYGKVAGSITGGTGRRLQQIGQYAILTGDAKVIAWARQLALQAAHWDPEGGSAMRYGDIGAHHLLRGLNWCYDACFESMTPGERETLRKIIVLRAEQFHGRLNPYRRGEANNHAWLQALGLAESAIVLAGEHAEAAVWAEYVRQLYLGRFLCCLGYQGDNNEGISYWNYGLGFIIDYADLMRAVCGIDLYRHAWLSQTARFPMYCAPPGAWAVSFADTGMPNHGTRGPAATSEVRRLALRTGDPYALWYSGRREPLDGLAPKPPADLPASIHYRHIGVAIFNTSLADGSEGVTVAMHSGRYWAGHQHPDQNHFVIHAYGEKLAIDGGYYDWYGSPHFNAYSMTSLAHNTLLVDGRGQAACTEGADGRITAWFDSPGYGYVAGDASAEKIYAGALRQFSRRILFVKPHFVVVHDLIESKAPARLDWLLHAVAPIELDQAAKGFRLHFPQAALRGRFYAPSEMDLTVKTGFPAEPVNRYSTKPVPKELYFPEWTLYASPRKKTAATEFLAAMQVQRLGSSPQPEAGISEVPAKNGRAVRFEYNGRTHLVLLRGPGDPSPISSGDLQCDGEAAAVELDAQGHTVRALAIGAVQLSWQGRKLVQSVKPQDWSR